ncbi:FKBP-type peptidyl-prolyl cis-trans isomerase [Candidatus Sumerlaeota bacterium]|nr:FKBP-type peptidyl-prolyl cis-trans isomerase [Candidatus Sumerlaeota bacterium]
MRKVAAVVTALVLLMSATALAAEQEKAPKPEKAGKSEQAVKQDQPTGQEKASPGGLKTAADKASYMVGFSIGESLKELKSALVLDILVRGMKDALEGNKPPLSDQEGQEAIKEIAEKVEKEISERNLKAETAFLAENLKKAGITATSSGLQYQVIKEGKGAKPKANDKVTVNYRGTLLDGTEFDSSYKRGQPATFTVNRVIPGWTEALQLMHEGSNYRLFIPSRLAYGPRPPGGPIQPNSMLIFEVDLLKVEPPEGEDIMFEKPKIKFQ